MLHLLLLLFIKDVVAIFIKSGESCCDLMVCMAQSAEEQKGKAQGTELHR